MIKSQETDKASDILKSLEELAALASSMASNLAYAALKSREAGDISTRVYEDVLDLVDHTGRTFGDYPAVHTPDQYASRALSCEEREACE